MTKNIGHWRQHCLSLISHQALRERIIEILGIIGSNQRWAFVAATRTLED